jgi:hypothetical protein
MAGKEINEQSRGEKLRKHEIQIIQLFGGHYVSGREAKPGGQAGITSSHSETQTQDARLK